MSDMITTDIDGKEFINHYTITGITVGGKIMWLDWAERIQLPMQLAPLRCHLLGLQQTASGYGSKLATAYKAKHLGRWYRVYCRQYSNVGTLYIICLGHKIIVDTNLTQIQGA